MDISRTIFLIFISSFFFLLEGSELLKVPFISHNGDKIEVVSTANSKWIVPVQEDRFYRGDFPKMIFSKAKHFKGKYGSFYLIDLSKNHQKFDATAYNELDIDTDVKHFNIALADSKLASKESNRIIAHNSYKIKLNPNMKGIDLQELKYVVVLTEEKPSRLDIIFKKSSPSLKLEEKRYKRSVWVWNARELDSNLIDSAKINRIYLQVGKDFSVALKRLSKMKNPPEVYALNGSPSDINNPQALIDSFSKLKLDTIKGIQLDVEPYLLKDFLVNPQKVWGRYLNMVKIIHRWTSSKGLRFCMVIPFWLDGIKLKDKLLLPQLLESVDEVVLMSYRSNPREFLKISLDTLRWGEILNRPVAMGIELRPIPTQKHTIYGIYNETPCIVEQNFYKRCQTLKLLNSFTINGSTISVSKHPKALEKLLSLKPPFSSFDGFALHDYSMLNSFKSVIK